MKKWEEETAVIVDLEAAFEAAGKREVELDINLLWHLHHEANTRTHTHAGGCFADISGWYVCVCAPCTACAFSVFTLYLFSVCVCVSVFVHGTAARTCRYTFIVCVHARDCTYLSKCNPPSNTHTTAPCILCLNVLFSCCLMYYIIGISMLWSLSVFSITAVCSVWLVS